VRFHYESEVRGEPSEPMAMAEIGDDRDAGDAMARFVAKPDGAVSTTRENDVAIKRARAA
jgi:hypothetical protein